MNWKGFERKRSWSYSEYSPAIFLQEVTWSCVYVWLKGKNKCIDWNKAVCVCTSLMLAVIIHMPSQESRCFCHEAPEILRKIALICPPVFGCQLGDLLWTLNLSLAVFSPSRLMFGCPFILYVLYNYPLIIVYVCAPLQNHCNLYSVIKYTKHRNTPLPPPN